jgi:two-component system, NarL family, sensor histidine kinase UhpB
LRAAQAELTLYRTAQEALTNVGKHSYATRVSLTLDYHEEQNVRLQITDDGRGSAGVPEGFGLLGARERVHLLGGTMCIHTGAGQGFTLTVELPV